MQRGNNAVNRAERTGTRPRQSIKSRDSGFGIRKAKDNNLPGHIEDRFLVFGL